MKKIKTKKQKRVGKTLKVILLGVLTLGIAGVLYSAITNRVENEIHPKFEVGALDTETGDLLKDEQKLYTPDLIEYNNLEISLAFDNNVNYQVFFYDEDGEFVSASDVQTKKFKDESEELKYARIVITPIVEDDAETEDVNESEEFKVTLLNKRKYTKQLTIVASVNEEVEEEVEEEKLLEFSVDGRMPIAGTYYFEKGMTWDEWVNSDYNPTSLSCSEDNLSIYGCLLATSDNVLVNIFDLIEVTTYTAYTFEPVILNSSIGPGDYGSTTYNFTYEEGMTWEEWFESDYVLDGVEFDSAQNRYTLNGLKIKRPTSTYQDFVRPTDVISQEISYFLGN